MIKTAIVAFGFLIAGFSIVTLFALFQPGYNSGIVQFSDGKDAVVTAPRFDQFAPTPKCTLDFLMTLPPIHATRFKCCGVTTLESMTINGQLVEASKFKPWPACSGFIADLSLGQYLKTGENRFHLQFHNGPDYITFFLSPSNKDPWTLFLILSMTLATFLAVKWLSIAFSSMRVSISESIVLVLGTLLRLLYVVNTGYFFRCYDLDRGHLQNLFMLSQYWTFPTSTIQSLEFFQPPLYYWLSVASTYFARGFGASTNSLITTWQVETCFLSIVTLALCIIIKRYLFTKEQRWQSNFFLIYLAVFPTLIYDANCISNDSLFVTLAFGWVALLLSIWKRISLRKWICMAALLGVGLITKGNTIPLIAVTFLTLLLTKQINFKAKLGLIAIGSMVLLVTAGWLYIPKALHSASPLKVIVNNIETIDKNLAMKPTIETFTTFDPISTIQHPFASQVATTDPRHWFFWEYFFKTAFSGETFFWVSNSGELQVQIIELTSILLLPLIYWGFVSRIRKFSSTSFPLVILLPLQCTAAIAYVLQAPFICNQHFRFSTIVVVPLTYFSIKGIELLPAKYQWAGQAVFVIMLLACAVFALLLSSQYSPV